MTNLTKPSQPSQSSLTSDLIEELKQSSVTKKPNFLARHNHFKQNLFCYRWRVIDSRSKTVDRSFDHLHILDCEYERSIVHEQILSSYKMRYRTSQSDMMSNLLESAIEFLDGRRKEASRSMHEETVYTESMAARMNHIFNVMLSCSIEMNTVLGFSELYLAVTEPELVAGGLNIRQKISALRARVSTSLYSIVVHGSKNQIKFFLMPIREMMGLENASAAYTPIATIQAELVDDQVVWFESESRDDVCDDSLDELCINLIKQLIESTKSALTNMD